MNHSISPDRKRLTITVDESEREQLRNWAEERAGFSDENFQSDAAMQNFLEPIVCNSELQWINPADTGDLTDAPMLGIVEGQDRESYNDTQDRESYTPQVIERWAYMNYQVRSPLEDLRDTGECVFVAE